MTLQGPGDEPAAGGGQAREADDAKDIAKDVEGEHTEGVDGYPMDNALSGFEPVEIDTTRAHPARMYDYLLGGYDNYEVDRIAAEQVIAAMPETRRAARELRTFMHRAVRYMAGEGVRQFLDIGSGVPTAPNVHDIAGAIVPGVRVAYIDNDPIVRVHAQARLTNTGDNIFVQADLREPRTILESPRLRELFACDEPVGLTQRGCQPFLRNRGRVRGRGARAVPREQRLPRFAGPLRFGLTLDLNVFAVLGRGIAHRPGAPAVAAAMCRSGRGAREKCVEGTVE